MAVLLALATSSLWGTSDFFGGLASRRIPTERVVLWAHGLGLLAVAAVAPFLADTVTVRDLLLGVIAGVVGLVGLLLLYSSLARGPMAVAAPLSALTAALVPVTWTIGNGAELPVVTTVGIGVGLIAVVAISWERTGDEDTPVTAGLIASTIFAGACFGSIILIYDATSSGTAPWPIVSGRVTTVALLLAATLVLRRQFHPEGTLGHCTIAGVGDTCANVTLLFAADAATTTRELSVVAVIAALYPAATVLWARGLLKERFTRIRSAGLVLGGIAVVLMTLG